MKPEASETDKATELQNLIIRLMDAEVLDEKHAQSIIKSNNINQKGKLEKTVWLDYGSVSKCLF